MSVLRATSVCVKWGVASKGDKKLTLPVHVCRDLSVRLLPSRFLSSLHLHWARTLHGSKMEAMWSCKTKQGRKLPEKPEAARRADEAQ